MITEGVVGVQQRMVGTTGAFRQGGSGESIVGFGHASYYEAVRNGRVFSVANQSGITTQAGLSGTAPALTLYNPLGSGVNAALLFAGCTITVAFAAAGVLWIAANSVLQAAAVTGTLSTAVRNLKVGGQQAPSVQALLAATLPAAPIAIAALGVAFTGAITTVPGIQAYGRNLDGAVIVTPGCAVSFQTSTASGASGFFGEFVWEEIDE